MKHPRWSHILTKGLTALRKGLSLSTKGIQDQKLGGKPVPSIFDFDFTFDIIAKKEINYQQFLDLKGEKLLKESEILKLNIISKKNIPLILNYILKAKKQKELESIFNLKASKSINFTDNMKLMAIKKLKIDNNVTLRGTKNLEFDFSEIIRATKSIPIKSDYLVASKKQISLNDVKPIIGKQDNTPILVALDLL